jgi:hypothetical protein
MSGGSTDRGVAIDDSSNRNDLRRFKKVNDVLYILAMFSFAHCNPWQADVKTYPGRGLVSSPGVTFLLKVSSRCLSNFHNSLFCDIIGTSRVISKGTEKLYFS